MNISGFQEKRRRDPDLVTLVEEYLSENSQLSFISIEDMVEKLQSRSNRYNRMKKQAFAGLVHKAYEDYCNRKTAYRGRPNETSNLQATKSKSIENIDLSIENIDSDSDIEIEEQPPRPNIASNQLSNLYGSPSTANKPSSSQYTYVNVNQSKDVAHTSASAAFNKNKIVIEPSFNLNTSVVDNTSPVITVNSNGNRAALITEAANGEDSDDLEIIDEVSGDSVSVSTSNERSSPLKAALKPVSLPSDDEDKIRVISLAKISPPLDKDSSKKPDNASNALTKSQSLLVPEGENKKGVKRKIEKSVQEVYNEETVNRKKLKKQLNVIQKSGVKLEDFAGSENVLEEICKLLMHLKHPEVYKSLGVTPPRGFLLHGPPGCGKTLLANAIAGELEMPMLKMAATELVSGVSGESESNIRDLFTQALSLAPCIVFIDEIDSVTPKRETAQREMERRIVAQLLSCIDDLGTKEKGDQVLLIGATNRIEAIDIGLRRAGRFDREICLGIPDVKAREKIIHVLCRGLRLKPKFDFGLLAQLTPGYVGADLQALIREAAVQAVNVALTDVAPIPIKGQFSLPETEEFVKSKDISSDVPNNSKNEVGDSDIEVMEICDDECVALIVGKAPMSEVSTISSKSGCEDDTDMGKANVSKHDVTKNGEFAEIIEITVTNKVECEANISKTEITNNIESEANISKTEVTSIVEGEANVPKTDVNSNGEVEVNIPKITVTSNMEDPANISGKDANGSVDGKANISGKDAPDSVDGTGNISKNEVTNSTEVAADISQNQVNNVDSKPMETSEIALAPTTTPSGDQTTVPDIEKPPESQKVTVIVKDSDIGSKKEEKNTGNESKETCDVGNVPGYSRGLSSLIEKTEVEKNNRDISSPLRWIKEISPLNQSQLDNLYIQMDDFVKALKTIQPSSKREGFATVPDITWDDIGALQDIRDELQVAILGPVKHAAEFQSLGLNTPAGSLLCGPPGVGKTLLAKAVANEAGINFISVKGPELLNMYVGESERAVRQCFLRARNSSPCVIFFDELDALCPRRSESADSGSGSRIVNQLLTEMDGMESRLGVFVMAATNRPDIIDPAILRPGRLDKIFFVDFPNAKDRLEILNAITKKGTKPVLDADVNLEEISSSSTCQNYTGADLAALVREASIAAFRELVLNCSKTEGKKADLKVSQRHFEIALLKTKPSVSKSDREKYDAMKLRFTGNNH